MVFKLKIGGFSWKYSQLEELVIAQTVNQKPHKTFFYWYESLPFYIYKKNPTMNPQQKKKTIIENAQQRAQTEGFHSQFCTKLILFYGLFFN